MKNSAWQARRSTRVIPLAVSCCWIAGCGLTSGDTQAPPPPSANTSFVAEVRETPCLPRELPVTDAGRAACALAQATFPADQRCACDAPGLSPASPGVRERVLGQLALQGYCELHSCSAACVCDVEQAEGVDAESCLTDATFSGVGGWCYLSPEQSIGAASLTAGCSPAHRLRLVGTWQRPAEQVLILACGQSESSVPSPDANAALGEPCQGLSESDPEFPGFMLDTVTIDDNTPACRSGICAVHHFQGRVSCPYGQLSGSSGCALPGSGEPVVVPVFAQIVSRPARLASVCSCRCAGPDAGPFCECPSQLECIPLIDDLGFGRPKLAGSYCLPTGSAYQAGTVDPSNTCRAELQNCE